MDKLAIKVFKMDDLSGDYDVDLAGNISLPLVGQIKAANLTTAQLDDELTKTLGAKYLEHPDISVAIRASTAHVVTVDGAVKEGGAFAVGGPGIFGTLPRQARASYDLMIIDGPPSLGLADAPLLAAAAGNTLFVVESGKTRTRAAIEALNRLQATGTRVLGAALTKSEEGSAAYGRYGYYGYDYANTRLKRTEILMIPQSGDAQQSTAPAESDA